MKTNFTEQDLQFYPTPKSLLDRITDSLKWNKITSVLEPSAGKGDIADYVKEKLNTPYTRYDIQIDCIEKDPALRKILEGKEYHVIHDDFLTYHGQYHYDLIILNPPFNEGDKHLEKALDMSSIKEDYASPMLTLKVGDHDCSENAYIYSVRRKYWNALFRNDEFMKNMTNDQQQSYLSQVDTLIHYDFSFCNIKEIQTQMAQTMVKGIEDCIIKMFDKCSNAHSWYPECSKNIHYYNGWCTNKAWIVNQKVILPISIFYKDYSNTTKISTSSYYNTCNVNLLHDLEKVFNYLGGTPQTAWDSYDTMRYVEKSEQIKNVRFRYFTVNFFKKGTAHITFTDENFDTLKKFNIFGSQQKGCFIIISFYKSRTEPAARRLCTCTCRNSIKK